MSKHCTKQPFPSQTVFDDPVTWSSEGSLLLKNLSVVVERIVEEFATEAISILVTWTTGQQADDHSTDTNMLLWHTVSLTQSTCLLSRCFITASAFSDSMPS